MSTKRKRRTNQQSDGLATGERLKRHKLATDLDDDWSSPWGWVGTSVTDASSITEEHLLATCGLSCKSHYVLCANKYRARPAKVVDLTDSAADSTDFSSDVVVISEDETPTCSKKSCSKNPNCLNYLGQDKWEDAEAALKSYLSATDIGPDPHLKSRKSGLPVGLRNLGATCYANAYIQVWFQDVSFRNGVYQCLPAQDQGQPFEDSPIFQLQATFAALQESQMKVFNPVKLVESLHLRANEQQDAQEFSKLFITHLDDELKKQPDPALKRLVSDQFEGKQAYATTCKRCGTRSENDSDFLEIEVNLEDNATLESRIQTLLEAETLSGDNKYQCSKCQSLQDATRQLVLRTFPPVLHFSLLRFVFDVATLERKKRKHNVSFPVVLDMNQFLDNPGADGENVYELTGVLVHKGSSAYHGHYEAMVFDVTHDSWFTFNDEIVTKMKAPGSERPAEDKSKAPAKKRRRVEDSDDEVQEIQVPPASTGRMSSKDAYMLVYTRRGAGSEGPTDIQKPPQRALDVVHQINEDHANACTAFSARQGELQAKFAELRPRMQQIYRSWNVTSHDQASLIVSQQALSKFLSRPIQKRGGSSLSHTNSIDLTESQDDAPTEPNGNGLTDKASETPEQSQDPGAEGEISTTEVLCMHGKLDPTKAGDMKRISRATYKSFILPSGISFAPELEPTDVCRQCVEEAFQEKLYQYEHPRNVAQFDRVSNDSEPGVGYWVSKHWLKDWRQPKPKMHVALKPDPAPDSEAFRDHVVCEHDSLNINIGARTRISKGAYALLRTLFPSWTTLSDEGDRCEVCDVLVESSREDKRELRKKAEEEKARLKHMQENALNGNTALLEDVACALVPATFVREWKLWILRPGHHPRPAGLSNASYICDHDLLALDLNSGDLDRSVCLVRRSDWDVLEELYNAAPLISVENRSTNDHGTLGSKFVHNPPLCEECRIKRKSDYDLTEVTVRVLGSDDPDPTPETYSANLNPPTIDGRQTSIVSYRSKNATEPQRQSKRIRSVKRRQRQIAISKEMSVKDIKLLLQDELDIPTICQRLFYQGRELHDSAARVSALGILANGVLDLREAPEDAALLDADADAHAGRAPEADFGGFGGTLLARGWTSESLLEDTASEGASPAPAEVTKACAMCTFENPSGAVACEMCEARL
ncbi:cysteine proteinase [Gloeopeniophorella convolvens]|nr:cysteine proteinase [Gloeopeniophorella convolvens]